MWFECYRSSLQLSEEEWDFLVEFTEEEFNEKLPTEFLINTTRKMTITDAVKSVMHHMNTGDWKYFGENEYLNKIGSETKISEWKPIDTAPKDGTEIIGRRGDVLRICSWESLDNPVARHLGIQGTWHRRNIASGKGLMGGNFIPTHWMTLPPLTQGNINEN